ncbi:uracil phosphoribosyltransferase [Fulvivirga imtechensis AK7]|uniref:Uracil phosphoribosyltransferase n=1 Tax=Fulvivirga imtechensis AK7 TaxID=1237149 RepID=L8JTU1_9BACT|nr:uracil phosphoribosyltransferase [Fulvivirga imtechensis]ELR70954.1 uracil phosphoribosyltransferase [Fulvivirga imtechensis AK7]
MVNILNQTHSIANHFLYEMRHKDIQKDRGKFRNNLKRLGIIMAYEVSKVLDYKKSNVSTPLADLDVELLTDQPVIISILRASMPFMEGFMEVFDQADAGFIGAYRREGVDEVDVNLEYLASPPLEGRNVIVVDPMLATGKSVIKSLDHLMSHGSPDHIHIVAAVAAPEGIDYISKSLKTQFTIWTGALDEKLNSNAYIIPGLGDAGDLCFGPKL